MQTTDKKAQAAREQQIQRDCLTVRDEFQTRTRGTNDQEYQIYLACADDGHGGDITCGGAPLKSYYEACIIEAKANDLNNPNKGV